MNKPNIKIIEDNEERLVMEIDEIELEDLPEKLNCGYCNKEILGETHSEEYDSLPFFCSETCYGAAKAITEENSNLNKQEEKMEKTDTWAGFGSEYLKAVEVKSKDDEYAIVGVSSKEENGKQTLLLDLERNEEKKKFGCNLTNLYAVQQECPNSPKDCIGRVITFNKVQVQKPGTNEIVDGLRIQFKTDEVETTEEDLL